LVVESEYGRRSISGRDVLHQRALAHLPGTKHDHHPSVVEGLEHARPQMALDHARHGKIVLARQIRRRSIGRSADYTPADRRDAHRQICNPTWDLARWIDTGAATLGEAPSGVMGKGIALQFKHAYPENFKEYRAACAAGEVRLGHMFVFPTGRLQLPAFIITSRPRGTGSRARCKKPERYAAVRARTSCSEARSRCA
jgi:hypothetical protein